MRVSVPQFDPVDGYDNGEYRYAVASAVKYAIRLRTKLAGRFLSDSEYDDWDLPDVDNDPESVEVLIEKLRRTVDHLWGEFLGPHGSGGIRVNDPFFAERQNVVEFVCSVQENHLAAVNGETPVLWNEFARWDLPPSVRNWLDRLPHPASGHPECPIQIDNAANREVRLLRRFSKTVTDSQFDVLQTLVEAFPERLTEHDLKRRSGHGDARGILTRLIESDSDFRRVILFSGPSRDGYGLATISSRNAHS